ncbi:MAG: hypothetical protein WC891_07895 [Actinomycetota bacterium]
MNAAVVPITAITGGNTYATPRTLFFASKETGQKAAPTYIRI